MRSGRTTLCAKAVPINDESIAGPSSLPLAITDVRYAPQPPTAARWRIHLFLAFSDGQPYVASNGARAFLLHNDRLIDLGGPRRDRVSAWGASPQDTLCVYDLSARPAPVAGCNVLTGTSTRFEVSRQSEWLPEVVITPTSPFTLAVSISHLPPNLELQARLYAVESPQSAVLASATFTDPNSDGVYAGTLATDQFVPDGYLHIFNPQDMTQGALVNYTLRGAPVLFLRDAVTVTVNVTGSIMLRNGGVQPIQPGDTLSLSDGASLVISRDGLTLSLSDGGTLALSDGGAPIELHNGDTLSLSDGGTLALSDGGTLSLSDGGTLSLSDGGTLSLSDGGTLSLSDGSAPVRSSDGQITLYTDPLNFGWGEFFTIQPLALLPNPPAWATSIGNAYRIVASPTFTRPFSGSISYQYLGSDIADEDEKWLHIYRYDGATWRQLPTQVDEYHNIAVAQTEGVGVFALMYSIEIELAAQGWELVGYPIQVTQTVTQALSSIADYHPVLLDFDPNLANPFERWSLYDSAAPDEFRSVINTLAELHFGSGYWISVTNPSPIQWKLQDTQPDPNVSAAALAADQSARAIPALYFGKLTTAPAELAPASLADLSLQAYINNTLCGIGHIAQSPQGTVYAIHVLSDQIAGGLPGCGAPGSAITLQLNGQELPTALTWDNQRLHQQEISQMHPPIETPMPTSIPSASPTPSPLPSVTPSPTPGGTQGPTTPGHVEYLPLIRKSVDRNSQP
ncbi:MAG: hypothetical protein R2911_23260 [Caldilineaceae bacterium]